MFSFAFSSFSKNSFVPDFAIVQRFEIISCFVIQIPLSSIVIVFFLSSTSINILKSESSHKKFTSVRDLSLALSIASEEFEINSLKNISLFE